MEEFLTRNFITIDIINEDKYNQIKTKLNFANSDVLLSVSKENSFFEGLLKIISIKVYFIIIF